MKNERSSDLNGTDPERRALLWDPDLGLISINALAMQAKANLRLIRTLDPNDPSYQMLVSKSLRGAYGGDEYKAWLLNQMTDDERTIAFTSVSEDDRNRLLEEMEVVLVREKAYQERQQMTRRELEPQFKEIAQVFSEAITRAQNRQPSIIEIWRRRLSGLIRKILP